MARLISDEPSAVALQPSDSLLVWENTLSPHTRHASITQVLSSMASLPATFASITVQGVQLVPGPSSSQFSTTATTESNNASRLISIQSRITSLLARIAALEGGTPLIQINTVPDQSIDIAFSITGTLSGFGSAPILQYADNASAWTAWPTGSTISATGFALLHPGVVGTSGMTVSVRNSAIPTEVATSNSFAVVDAALNVPGPPINLRLVSATTNSLTIGFEPPA